MAKSRQLSEVWLKASILGSTWAASEIILGSFLHNLRVPFSGNVLTAIGFILLIAASYKWREKGLFWRAGLICALMKTISPSAVIFGPMIAIFMEAMLLELSVRLLGRNFAGFALGSSLAMAWILVQKIANMVIFYGASIVDIYTSLMKFAEKQLRTSFDLVWTPIIILLAAYILFGLVAVLIAMRIGRSLDNEAGSPELKSGNTKFSYKSNRNDDFPYSMTWLVANFLLLVMMMFVLTRTAIYVWAPASIVLVLIWVSRYKRGMRQLSKPKFWIWFVILTMLSAFAITAIQGSIQNWQDGLITGLQMNFRAAVVIVGFSVLGTELYNPRIRRFFAQTSYRQVPVALELAFESLPGIIERLPDVRSFFRQPGSVIRSLIFLANKRLNTYRRILNKPHFIVCGDVAEGKTRFLISLSEYLRGEIFTGGFVSPRMMKNDLTVGYELRSLRLDETVPFLEEAGSKQEADIGKFMVRSDSFIIASDWLKDDINQGAGLIFIDEVGRWELEGKGWDSALIAILNESELPMLWSVRRCFVEEVVAHYHIPQVIVIDIADQTPQSAGDMILEKLRTP